MSGNKYIAPWKEGILNDWAICGMNHYHIQCRRMLFVSMVKDGKCITEEGADDVEIWNRLIKKAQEI